ncbi:TetR/AcrR family transcriptional regulator [Prosthecomicrobium hirschii]|uniref:TetR family transcriptional regulator n=1 Tax=Prosthecodimorpha hirschii TaxID=665126 RepID=A0A0P6W3D4_9HYPH|nr:TetR/AcrR family transcriptional regulator [Prosthecomicrobium hirschii]KPL52877.1 TetR family transcriptional regulator [Prosthecomicrobium hirschii]MCW1841835.1 TetR/AcrR family transcriptional regulator [Prosthecomicrobium hirschii]TPQ50383.1 TetR/AcrR family transcriptional regulator [Prosthecomicrobium hirschii]
MARPRAVDHDDKRRAILKAAARLFADGGYDRSSMAEVAKACGVSKALVYHYYVSKDVLLYDIIRLHLDELVAAVEGANGHDEAPRERLVRLASALLDAYRDADAEHKIQINELKKLPPEQQDELRDLERRLVGYFAAAIAAAVPALAGGALLKPVTMSLFGMLNWHYLWFRPGGPVSREDYARLAVTLAVDGAGGLQT